MTQSRYDGIGLMIRYILKIFRTFILILTNSRMKNILILLFCVTLSTAGFAQLSKSEKKEWKKKAKEFSKSPEALKQLTEEKQAAETQASTLNAKVTQLQSNISDKDAKNAELEDQLTQLRSQLTTTKAELATMKENPVTPVNSMDFSKGVVFKVQIGAFKNKDLSKYFENNPNFGGEKSQDGVNAYTIGLFRDYWEADTFKKYMREMGVKDAWIVPFKDGQRVDIKDVLEGVVNEKPAGTN
jgi:hypothetical protein